MSVLRPATEQDVATIRVWRNHPKVRAASIWTAHITPDGHRAWWDRVQTDPAKRVLIFEFHGSPAGVVTINDLDPAAGSAEWGFFLDVDGLTARGELLPAWMDLEREAIDYAFDELGVDRVGGRTLASNRPVLDLHRRFGFHVVPERGYTTDIDGVDTDVVWTEMGKEDRRGRRA
jgi:RimJ/RimL family protein N-acetyltransferase